MLLKFGSVVRVSACSLLVLILFIAAATAQNQVNVRPKEGHAPRTKPVQKSADADRDADRDGDRDEEGDRENPRGREQWFLQGRLHNGRPAPRLLIRAQQQRDVLRQQAFHARQLKDAVQALRPQTTGGTTPGWKELGPSPMRSVTTVGDPQDYGFVTGRVTAVAVDQTDLSGNTVYIGGAYGGVWKSTTAANPDPTQVVWTPITDDQATLAVGSIAISPGDHNIVLVGTGEANSSSDSYYGLGILRSTDAGNSWALISSANNGLRPFQGLAFAKFAFNSDNPSIVVAATAAASEGITVGAEQPANSTTTCANTTATATCRGLYYSYDSGQTWSQVTMVDPSGAPDNGSASDVIYNSNEKLFYAWSRAHGLYTSMDGRVFTRATDVVGSSGQIVQPSTAISLANCPSAVSSASLISCPMYRGQITQVPGRDEMYVWFVDASTTPVDGGIYQTKDGGKTWATLNRAAIDSCGDSSGCGTEQGDYNLVLTAVPNGATATDLYAGAINIYRCQISSNNPTCTASPFVNLTRVYGCTPVGSFSKVHPDEHSFDFLVANPNIIYFGNDGGIYRTIASQNGAVVPSVCPGSAPSQPFYPFDNLNGTMGSMTQFVWFQQHPTNQYTMVGGTQDNGSPAIDSSNGGSNGITWHSVLDGDGGWTDINPNSVNASEWFTENTGLSPGIQRCTVGVNCTDAQFSPVINSAKVGGDSAAFYMPFMLDPQNSSEIILGTCRVWRVGSTGSSPTALSPKFDGSTSGACASGSPSVVSALAAGGAKTSGSQTIYAGTADGHIWVTTAADSGTTSWADRSPVAGGFAEPNCSTPPCQYPASGIAIDPRDATGRTAYVTAMGFGIGHVWMTTNAGQSWTDISGTNGSGGIPDSPADGAVVDPNSGTIYVATDVGVYSTATAAGSATQWAEVGPATGAGTLPNVAVTRVAIFNPSGLPPRLRVSTYGRGIWEMVLPGSAAPDYELGVSNADLETFPGQAVTYNGTAVFNNYAGNVMLSCNAAGGALPATCSSSAISGGAFAVTASNPTVQDFSFQIQGTDGTLVRQTPVTLRVVDFALGAPSPASIPNLVHGNSSTVQVGVMAMGSFDQTVTIDCDPATVPAGMTCAASPVVPTTGGSQVTLTIGTTVATAPNTYAVTIRATSTIDASHSAQHTQSLQVTVTASAGFALDASGYTRQTLKVGQPFSAAITLDPHDGPSGIVNLTCSDPAFTGTCTVSPGSIDYSVTANNSPTSLTITLATPGAAAGAHQIMVMASDGTNTSQASLPFALTDFSVAVSQQPGNGVPGGNVQFAVQLTPVNGYSSQVTLSCNSIGLGNACTFTPASPTLTPGVTTVVNGTLAVPAGASAGQYSIGVVATDASFTGLSHAATTANFMVQTNPDFSFTLGSQSATVTAGGGASAAITLNGTGGFNSTVSWSVTGCPSTALMTCTVTPNPASAGQQISLNITTTAPSVSSVRTGSGRYLALWIGLPFGTLGIVFLRRRKLVGIATFLLLLGLAACGGGGGGGGGTIPITHPGTPAGMYSITVVGTSGTTNHSQSFNLTVQ